MLVHQLVSNIRYSFYCYYYGWVIWARLLGSGMVRNGYWLTNHYHNVNCVVLVPLLHCYRGELIVKHASIRKAIKLEYDSFLNDGRVNILYVVQMNIINTVTNINDDNIAKLLVYLILKMMQASESRSKTLRVH